MYNYFISEDHFVVEIDGYKLVLDTGGQSGLFGKRATIYIDGNPYEFGLTTADYKKTFECVKCDIDGFIGGDKLSQMSLTITKENETKGTIDFCAKNIAGNRIPLERMDYHIFTHGVLDGNRCKICIDTGAMYGYGKKSLLEKYIPTKINQYDYNPNPLLDVFYSNVYENMNIELKGIKYNMTMGYSNKVEKWCLKGVDIIGSCIHMFNNICVIDYTNNVMILD